MKPNATPDYSPARTLLRAALQHPQRTSLIWGYEGKEWSVSRSAQAVRRLAHILSETTTPGDTVAIIGPNSPWHFLIHVAGAWAGTVTVPLSPRLPTTQLIDLISDCTPRIIITTDEHATTLTAALTPHAPEEKNTPHPLIWTFNELETTETSTPEIDGTPPARDTELAAIVYTSGSSGTPRGVELTHAQLWWGSMSFRDGFEYNPGTDIVGVCAPLSHIGGFNGTTMDAFAHGGTVVVLPGFEPETVLRAIDKHRITQMFLVPVMCHLLADAQEHINADLSSYRNPLIGGDAMGPELEQRLRNIGLRPIHVWGMTETAGAGAMLSADTYSAHAGAIGLPFPYIDIRLVDSNNRTLTPTTDTDTLGEIQVRGPGVSSAYYKRPTETAQSRHDGWLKTGDLATYDTDGFIHMVGRASRMIHTAGEMVAPRRVEEALRALPTVTDALAVGLPDERWGHVVSALIVPTSAQTLNAHATNAGSSNAGTTNAGSSNAGSTEHSPLPRPLTQTELHTLRTQCENALAPWESVRIATWVEKLPLTSTGKPDPQAAQKILHTTHNANNA